MVEKTCENCHKPLSTPTGVEIGICAECFLTAYRDDIDQAEEWAGRLVE